MNIKLLRFFELILWETPEGASAAADGTEPVVEPEAPAPELEVTEPPAPPAPAMVPVEVMQRRVSALTRQKADLERQLELMQLGQTLDPAAPPQPAPQARPNLINEAQLLAEQMRREEKAQAVATAGLGLSPDFMLRINTMNQMLGQLPNTFLDAVMDAGETDEGAAQLLYDLSQDLQKAGGIINLSPTKMAVALTKIQQGKGKGAPAPKPRTAPVNPPPAPITPKTSGGKSAPIAGDLADPNLSLGDWMTQRDKAASSSRRY